MSRTMLVSRTDFPEPDGPVIIALKGTLGTTSYFDWGNSYVISSIGLILGEILFSI